MAALIIDILIVIVVILLVAADPDLKFRELLLFWFSVTLIAVLYGVFLLQGV